MLQATILLRTGKKITYDQLLHFLLVHAKDRVLEAIIDDIQDQNIDWERIAEGIDDFGITDSSKVNEIVYGDA